MDTKKDLVIDDEVLRKANTKKVVDTVEKIGEYVGEARKQARMSKYYLLGFLCIIVFMIMGSIIAIAFSSGGFINFVENTWGTDITTQRIICETDGENFSMRFSEEAYYFRETFNETKCWVIHKNGRKEV